MTTDGLLAVHTYRRASGTTTLPLVLLHGFPLDRRMWDDVVGLLPGDRPVLALDLPGLGASPSGEDVAEALGRAGEVSLEVAADAVASTLADLDVDSAVVAGLSMGGYVAMALAERHPDLVAGLALLDTKSTADAPQAVANRLRIADAVVAETSLEPVLGMRTTLLGETDRTLRPDLVARLEQWILDQGPAGVAWSQRAMAARPDRTGVLEAFPRPSVVVVGDEDELSPVDAAEHMDRALALDVDDALRVELTVLPRVGHMSTIEAPEPVAIALSALSAKADVVAGR